MRKIKNAHDAWWFLYYHPKFMLPFWIEVRDEKHAETFKEKMVSPVDNKTRNRYTIKKDKGGNLWACCPLKRHALTENLSIHYTKVNKHGEVDDNNAKNKHVEVWLEFGPLQYGYDADWQWQNGERVSLQHFHDVRLDTGAPTFDEALVSLARLALKFYGDYKG